jgi:hypothetical protein
LRLGKTILIIGWSPSLAEHLGADMMTHSKQLDARLLATQPGSSQLAEQIEGQIERRASGRIRDLHVVCDGDQITLNGHSRTYHAKQLALQAVLDLTDGHAHLANLIVVN